MSVSHTVKLLGLGVVVATLSLEGLLWLYQRLRQWSCGGPLKEVLFFPASMTCVEHLFCPPGDGPCPCPLPHGPETSFTRLLRHLLSARATLDLCLFSFSSQELSRAVLHMHRRRVAVRVVIDKDYLDINGSQVGRLLKAGISVRHDTGSYFMHHKFALVDGRLLLTGSLNWTMTAVQGNRENVLVTEDPAFVKPFLREFEELWTANDPAAPAPTLA